ncbi:hypothetical protein [Chiayiivirga flava]|uniref:Uncharacterized protein n=1 Tax=Chiayiivirga flava TaxID=659595 RepID=A0A7W8G1U8_9GAMM|nr:hypothetical protein [Chiayiivirga flava]MBB5209258.1 hypothetical protein [Chiayiivirga flava]
MTSHEHSDAAIELGKRLVAQLELGDDVLSQWLAHDLATHVAAVDTAEGEARASARERCVRSILALWERRSVFPRRLRPFAGLEPLMQVITSLDIESANSRYLSASIPEDALSDAPQEMRAWLELVPQLDFAARATIRHIFRLACEEAALNARPWVELAKKAALDIFPEEQLIQFVLDARDAETTGSDGQLEQLREQVERLEGFVRVVAVMAADLRTRLPPNK